MNTKRERKRKILLEVTCALDTKQKLYIYIYIPISPAHSIFHLSKNHTLSCFFFLNNDTPLKTTRPYTVTVSLDYVRCIEQLVATANEISAGARGRHVVGVAMRTYVADQHTSSPAHPACLLLLPLLLFQPTLATDSRGNF